jgi:hypothetical protein
MRSPGSSVLRDYPHDSAGDGRQQRDRVWWPRTRDLAAMVGLADTIAPGGRVQSSPRPDDVRPTGDAESATVYAAGLSQLFR